jgi:CheY-like chemotaxis protein
MTVQSEIIKCFEAGMDNFISKPPDLEMLK